jgi:hypothetical protein
MKKNCVRALAIVLPLITMIGNVPAQACAIGADPYFTYSTHPDIPLNSYARGQLGILQPSYARSYLLVAYRYLSNQPLSDSEQKTAVEMWNKRLTAGDASCQADTSAWLKARSAVPGVSKLDSIFTERPINDKEAWQTYCNCQTSSFQTAARTLNDLIDKFGVESAGVKEWTKAQDAVFSNCGYAAYGDVKKPAAAIPEALPDSADRLLQKNRNYQIAAANFYAQNFDAAREQFDRIAADKDSPWRQTAAYLAARSLIRQATLIGNTNPLLLQAKERLEKLAADPANANLKADIEAVLGYVEAKLDPQGYVAGLLNNVVPAKNIGEITFTLDQMLGDSDGSQDNSKPVALPATLLKDDALDWVMTFQNTGPEAKRHALEHWKQTKSIPWLVAAISSADPKDPDAGALVSAAEAHESSAPGHWTLFYEANRLKLGKGQTDAVREALDKTINNPPADLPAGALNQLRTQRLALARNLDEFVKFGVQTPLVIASDAGVQEVPDDMDQVAKMENFKPKPLTPEFIPEAGGELNNQMPLSMLVDLSTDTKLPPNLRNNVAWTSWVRAVLIGDDATAQRLAPIVKDLNKKKAPFVDAYLAAKDPADRKFAAANLMLHFSSAQPNATAGLLQEDSYGDASGWWWAAKPVQTEIQSGMGDSTLKPIKLPFITDAQKAQVKSELAKLNKVATAPNYFASVVLPFAKEHPTDSRVPEALHWFVKSTRYGVAEDSTKALSKEAFSLLHTKYKGNPWTAKTPYFY